MNFLLVYPMHPGIFRKRSFKFVSKKDGIPPLKLLTVASSLPAGFNQKFVSIDTAGLIDEDILLNQDGEHLNSIKGSNTPAIDALTAFPILKEISKDNYCFQELKENFVLTEGQLAFFDEAEIEKRVSERTAALSRANQVLKKELSRRKITQEQTDKSLQEKITLLREIHHRVKNNLQIISSLLNLQSGYIEDEKSLAIFRESQNRVRSMTLIHEKLGNSKDLNTEFGEYVTSLCCDLFRSYSVDQERVTLKSSITGISFEINTAILCGLIINELISNALKYAFPGDRKGEITIEMDSSGNNYSLIIRDNGIGFSADLDFRNTDSLGLQLVNTLTDQLGGEIELINQDYTEFRITFPGKTVEKRDLK